MGGFRNQRIPHFGKRAFELGIAEFVTIGRNISAVALASGRWFMSLTFREILRLGPFVEPVQRITFRLHVLELSPVHELDVAIIGAGPYGLSLAAQLKVLGVENQVFGTPMSFWRNSMPPGMELKSEGPACDLFDSRREFTIEQFYKEISRPFIGRVIVPAEIFLAYGLEFQKRFVPDVDLRDVANVSRSDDKFILRLQDGRVLRAARVVVATGIRDYAYVPEALRGLPKEFVTHSAEYGPVDHLAGRKVLVIGGGASAVDLAWSLFERGSDVSLVCRQPKIKFHSEPPPRNWYSAIRSPDTPIGGGWNLFFYTHAPHIFRLLPEKTRRRIIATALGPSPGWFMTDRVPSRVPILGGLQVTGTAAVKSRVNLITDATDGRARTLTADHVVAATGYRVDIRQTRVPRRCA